MNEIIVNHIAFGKGTVVSQNEKYIIVKFYDTQVGEKTFVYPDAFDKFIVYEDENLQKEIIDTLLNIKQKADEEAASLERKRVEAVAAEKERIKALQLSKLKKKAPSSAKKKVQSTKKSKIN